MSNPKTKRRCWIVRTHDGIRVCKGKPEWHSKYWDCVIGINNPNMLAPISLQDPEKKRMWRRALKGKRGKDAIVECCGETWRPIIEKHCWNCKGSGTIERPMDYADCLECNGTGKIKRTMDEDDL